MTDGRCAAHVNDDENHDVDDAALSLALAKDVVVVATHITCQLLHEIVSFFFLKSGKFSKKRTKTFKIHLQNRFSSTFSFLENIYVACSLNTVHAICYFWFNICYKKFKSELQF